MKNVIVFLCLCFFSLNSFGLSVTPNPVSLGCGTSNVSFTFDCAFTGSVLIPNTPNGVLSFDITVSSAVAQNFGLSFIVLSSDMSSSCAPINTSVNASFTSTCSFPSNNNCVNAQVLSITTSNCIPNSYATNGVTSSGYIPNCGVPPGYMDLYYKFNANNDTVKMEIPAIPGTVGFYALYDDCPGSGTTQVDCSIMIASNGSTYLFTNLNVGADYYIQILFLPGNVGTDQEICLHSTTPQANGNCPNNIIVSDGGPDFPNQSYVSSQSIQTVGPCSVTSSGLFFDAGSEVILGPGFETGIFDFEIMIGGCIP